MKVKKYVGKTVNGFKILDTYVKTLPSGKTTRKVLLKCENCGREFERCASVDLDHAKCKCKCEYLKPKPCKYHFIEWQGRTYTQTEFCKLHDIKVSTLRSRLAKGMSIEQAIQNEFEKVCPICGKTFITTKLTEKYCSNHCIKQLSKVSRKKRYKGLKKIGEFDKSVTLENVYKKFNGICQNCGKRLNFNCDSNSNDYPSIDHIKPLSKGGCHKWDNVQLLCRHCNEVKGAN